MRQLWQLLLEDNRTDLGGNFFCAICLGKEDYVTRGFIDIPTLAESALDHAGDTLTD